jgi:hypothetical protein
MKTLIAAYDLLNSTFINVLMGEIASDIHFAGSNSPTDVIGYQQIDQMIHPVNANLKQLWDWMFAGVQELIIFWSSKIKLILKEKNKLLPKHVFKSLL